MRLSLFTWHRNCGLFFVFLATLSLSLSWVHFFPGRWRLGLLLLVPGVLIFGSIAWLVTCANRSPHALSKPGPDAGGAGLSGAGKPVPVRPTPSHHLVAAKDLPPSDKTHSLPKD